MNQSRYFNGGGLKSFIIIYTSILPSLKAFRAKLRKFSLFLGCKRDLRHRKWQFLTLWRPFWPTSSHFSDMTWEIILIDLIEIYKKSTCIYYARTNGKEVTGEKEVNRSDFLFLSGGGAELISRENFFVFFSWKVLS